MKFDQVAIALCLLLPIAALVYWSGTSTPPPSPQAGPWTRHFDERRDDAFPRTFVNASGEVVEVQSKPSRIVSGTIFSDAVLLEVGDPSRVLALHEISKDVRYSPIAEASSAFPRHHRGGAEEVLALAPDLVVVSSFSREETRHLLARQGCAVVRFEGFESLEDIENNLRAFGYVLGEDAVAERLVAEMRERFAKVAEGAPRRTAWRLLHLEGGRTSGLETTFHDLVELTGASNVAAELEITGSLPIDVERVLLADPDALVLEVVPGQESEARQRLLQTPGFASLRALQNDRIIMVPAGVLQSTSHHVAGAAEFIAAALDQWGQP